MCLAKMLGQLVCKCMCVAKGLSTQGVSWCRNIWQELKLLLTTLEHL